MGVYGGFQLPRIDENSLDDKKERKQILNSLMMLDEKLRYMFQNIDIEENLSEDSRKMFFQYGKDIQNVIKDTDGKFSLFEQTVDGITTAVQDNKGNISLLQQRADALAVRVSNAEGDIAALDITADHILTRVSNAEGDISSLEQTAKSITSQVNDLDDELGTVSSKATQTAKEMSWIVESGTSASSMRLTDRFLEIVGEEVVIDADMLLRGEMTLWRDDEYERIGGYIGYATGDDKVNAATEGVAMSSYDGDHYVIATTSGVRMTAKDQHLVVTNETITATTPIDDGSDRRIKNSISYEMERYEDFFTKLQPSFYKMNKGTSNRYHIGFIAQDVEKAILDSGMTTQDFAGLVQHKREDEQVGEFADLYGLRYSEFIALNTYMIQKLMRRIAELERKVEALS